MRGRDHCGGQASEGGRAQKALCENNMGGDNEDRSVMSFILEAKRSSCLSGDTVSL